MFTGIIEDLGKVARFTMKGADALLEVATAMDLNEVSIGDSIAVNGACLTVKDKTAKTFTADVSAESLARTTLGRLQPGARVNLEKSLRIGGFLGGHFVLGHVDGTGRIMSKTQKSGSMIFAFAVDDSLSRYIVEKGSIAIDGISLTVNKVEKGRFYVNIIPHTAANTTLVGKKEADPVNIETDILGKYVEKLLQSPGGVDKNFLSEYGFIK